MSTSAEQLLKYSYTTADKVFLQMLFSVQKLGRQTAIFILLFLRKHEKNKAWFWGHTSVVFENCRNSKTLIETCKKTDLEQKYCSDKKYLKSEKIRVIAFWEKEYPQLLLQTADFPLLLFVKGNEALLQQRSIAVVGTRKVTPYGQMVTKKLTTELVEYGYTIVSGCMYGVDAIAHTQALESQGNTIAVLGYGFGCQIPTQAQHLQEHIIAGGGCVITEYVPYTPPTKGTFPERNRIVAGLSLGVLVTEAALKSGTHITADCALDAGREVFAVPGSILNPFSRGTTYLLNQGAYLVNSGTDVVAQFQKVSTIPNSCPNYLDSLQLDAQAKEIVEQLLFLPQTTDELARKVSITIQELLALLSVLELENIIENEAGVWRCVVL